MPTQIILSGKILPGRDPATTKAKFAELHKISLSRAEVYFTGQPQVLRVESDPERARQIQQAYINIGVECTLKTLSSRQPTPPPPKHSLDLGSVVSETAKNVTEKVRKDLSSIKTSHSGPPLGKGYETTKTIARVFAGIGWFFAVVGLLTVLSAIVSDSEFAIFQGVGGAMSLIGGLVLVMAGQLTRAIVDIADTNRQILDELKPHS